jgi:hypothetical protein
MTVRVALDVIGRRLAQLFHHPNTGAFIRGGLYKAERATPVVFLVQLTMERKIAQKYFPLLFLIYCLYYYLPGILNELLRHGQIYV